MANLRFATFMQYYDNGSENPLIMSHVAVNPAKVEAVVQNEYHDGFSTIWAGVFEVTVKGTMDQVIRKLTSTAVTEE